MLCASSSFHSHTYAHSTSPYLRSGGHVSRILPVMAGCFLVMIRQWLGAVTVLAGVIRAQKEATALAEKGAERALREQRAAAAPANGSSAGPTAARLPASTAGEA